MEKNWFLIQVYYAEWMEDGDTFVEYVSEKEVLNTINYYDDIIGKFKDGGVGIHIEELLPDGTKKRREDLEKEFLDAHPPYQPKKRD